MRAGAVLDEKGVIVIEKVLTGRQCDELIAAFDGACAGRAGSRSLLDVRACQALAAILKAHTVIGVLLPERAVAVQCTLFDKSSDKNWLVALHQDLSIPVQERVADPLCSGWSEKEGVLYVQPPVAVLESFVAVRVHLDDCGPENGPLRVVPGSHRYGRLSAQAARTLRSQRGDLLCDVRRGDVVVMRPLLLHASSKARDTRPRRVLHFLFGSEQAPCGLKWHRAV